MQQKISITDHKVDLRVSLTKPLHANWLISVVSTLSEKCDTIKKPFETVGNY